MIDLTLPWPPTINHFYGRTRTGRTYITKAGKAYQKEVLWLLTQEEYRTVDTECGVLIEALPPDNRRRDIDNIQKVLLDTLQQGNQPVLRDDCLISDLRIVRQKYAGEMTKGTVKVKIWEQEFVT